MKQAKREIVIRQAEERLLREKENEEQFKALKSKFFGLVISDNEISVKVFESIRNTARRVTPAHLRILIILLP